VTRFNSITEALELLVPPFQSEGDWHSIIRKATAEADPGAVGQRARSPRHWRQHPRMLAAAVLVLVLIAILATPALGVQRLVLDLFGRKNVSFQKSSPAPNEIKKQFEDLAIGAPVQWAPEAIASEARTAGTLPVSGHPRALWVVPTRRGGYCYEIEHSIGGCRQTAADRDIGTRGEFGVSYSENNPIERLPVLTRIAGDIETPRAASITVRYADATSTAVPFIWVSKPIAAGFFSFDIPTAHWNVKGRVVSVTLEDSRGRQLAVQTFPARRVLLRPNSLPARATGPKSRLLPTKPPVAATQPLQQGSADGFKVVAGRNGAVQFTEIAATPALRELVGHSVSYSCFRLTREFGIFTVRGLGQDGRFGSTVGFQITGVGTPFDGCDIEGSAGHLWPDRDGSHSVVEIAFTRAGRAFFADRAAARDLALFVHSSRVRTIRRERPTQALRDLRAAYGKQLAHSRIRIRALGADELEFSERSTTGKTFIVIVRNGRITKKNVSPYAFAS
jgi:hypothetical protein